MTLGRLVTRALRWSSTQRREQRCRNVPQSSRTYHRHSHTIICGWLIDLESNSYSPDLMELLLLFLLFVQDNVTDLAHHFFGRCLEGNVVPYVVTKKTVFKWQEGFWTIMKSVFDEHYKYVRHLYPVHLFSISVSNSTSTFKFIFFDCHAMWLDMTWHGFR